MASATRPTQATRPTPNRFNGVARSQSPTLALFRMLGSQVESVRIPSSMQGAIPTSFAST